MVVCPGPSCAMTIPNNMAFLGAELRAQGIVLFVQSTTLGAVTTEGLRLRIGL